MPPMRTKRTSAPANAASIAAGSNGGSATASFAQLVAPAQDEPRRAGGVGKTLGGRSAEGAREQGARSRVGLAETDADLETGSPDEPLDELGGGGAGPGLDAGDGRLRDARAAAKVGLGESGPLAGLADEAAEDHHAIVWPIGYTPRLPPTYNSRREDETSCEQPRS